ncbi:eukaryotic translation initiation factor 3 -related [Holotrichia oblita]|uniref:Eukaryotic translation initiation factor 3 -related n=1 Tax=Holotrichia oblita TaxID=644536 RepID=A0ACB9T295_HOLOL|nr:eukaryotic translation initiation factor 3 -related [Holotrichia oblita]
MSQPSGSSDSQSQSAIALKTWEMANKIETINTIDEIYRYDKQQQQDILTAKPWEKDPHFFKDIKISALALLKMVMHARSGGNLEVMGLILGKIDGNTMFVMDSFALPVEGTETRVNAQAQAYEYMSSYMDAAKMGYKPANEEPSEYQTIPLNKIEDFGVHCKQYYSLEVSYFKSTLDRRLLDSLWNKYWVNTLSSSSLLTNADYTTGQMVDLSEKLEQSEAALGRGGFMVGGTDPHEKRTEDKLMKATKDSCKTTIEIIHGLMAQMIKDRLFNGISPKPIS